MVDRGIIVPASGDDLQRVFDIYNHWTWSTFLKTGGFGSKTVFSVDPIRAVRRLSLSARGNLVLLTLSMTCSKI